MSAETEYIKALYQEYMKLNPCSRRLYEEACKVIKGGNTRAVLMYLPYPRARMASETVLMLATLL